MPHRHCAFAAFALVLASVAPARAGAPRFATAAADMNTHHVVRITAFGSSSTKGVGASSPATNYPSRLQGDLAAALPAGTQVVVTNRGIGGEDAEDMMRRLPAVLAEHPDLLIWQTGTNDPLRGLPLPRFIELTRAGLTAIRAAGVDAMLMEPQDCPVFAGKPGALAYRDAVRSLAAEFGIPVVRRYDLMQTWLTVGGMTPKQLEAPDGLHMSDTGYALLARAVAQTILTGLPKAAPRAVVTVATLEPKF